MNHKNMFCGAMLIVILSNAKLAYADSIASDLTVVMEVEESCEIQNLSDMSFGVEQIGGTQQTVNSSANIQWRCSGGTSAAITISDGLRNNRTMLGPGSNTLAYQLYRDSGYSEVWGSSIGEGVVVIGTGAESFTDATIYGEILSTQIASATPGYYVDTVQVSITVAP